jgi:hypothetical protein
LPDGAVLVPQLVRRGRVMTRGRAFALDAFGDPGAFEAVAAEWAQSLTAPSAHGELEEEGGPSPAQRRRVGGTAARSEGPKAVLGLPSSPTRPWGWSV